MLLTLECTPGTHVLSGNAAAAAAAAAADDDDHDDDDYDYDDLWHHQFCARSRTYLLAINTRLVL